MRVIHLRAQGLSYAMISAALNAEGVPTPAGKPKWLRSYVDRPLHTRWVKEILASQPHA